MKFDNQLDQKLLNWVIKNLRKAETISLVIIAIVLIIKAEGLVDLTPLLTVTFSTLAVFYFFRAMKVFEEANITERFLNKILSYGWSICIISIMFIIQGWPGAESMMPVGVLFVTAVSIAVLFLKQKNPDSFKTIDKEVLLRNFIIAALSIALLSTPKEQLIKHHIISKHIEMTKNKNAP